MTLTFNKHVFESKRERKHEEWVFQCTQDVKMKYNRIFNTGNFLHFKCLHFPLYSANDDTE